MKNFVKNVVITTYNMVKYNKQKKQGGTLILSSKIEILGINYDNVNLSEGLSIVKGFLEGEKAKIVVTPNAEIAQLCIENVQVKNAVNNADLILPDGIGVIYASRILKKRLKQKVAGVEMALSLLPILEQHGKTLFLFGGKEGVAEQAKQKINEKCPLLKIVGTKSGYFNDENDIIKSINEKSPDVLFVCLGAPKQELFMSTFQEKIHTKVMLGLGGTLDLLAGNAKRAPKIYVRFGLEWLYRLFKEPKRFKRMLKLPKYLFIALKQRFIHN